MQLQLLSFSPPLSKSPSPHHKIRENWIQGQLQLFRPKPAPTEPSQFSQSSLAPFGVPPSRTIRPKHEWMRVLVFLFSAPPPSFFVTLTTESEWRGVSVGEQMRRHSGNTRDAPTAIGEADQVFTSFDPNFGSNWTKMCPVFRLKYSKNRKVTIQATEGTHQRPSLAKTTKLEPAWIEMP